ncbi:Flp pilus assembly complex ATPase component TadA [Gemella sp. zg-570]|uniref:competence type IV pilus ATPase ComGA n=1 Tax=Gemella sp. zg-570 TaxID=2840371 RepID=UPI001C0BEE4D|nr:competence type IV pilus ATPase ComGA [Gemella sp. zg-570]QWQ38481.1 Flp pilus assembly complex ATPase component TadA [Gemella sp. zg-570]
MISIDIKELMINILNMGIESNASDIHIYPKSSGSASIKYRIKGSLEEKLNLKNSEIDSLISLLKFNASIDIALNKTPQSGRFEYKYKEKKYYLRISTIPLNELYEGCVVRIFTDELAEVNFSLFEEDVESINKLSKYANGLIIFSGPTGSGKSTSMYKLALDIAKQNRQIISIEDPVEKNFDSLIQMQVNEKAGINYDNALKSILRCDPDAIMVGEIRDSLTAKYVITSSYSGHLVLTTLHAENCIGVINRLVDLGISKEDLRQTLLCIISQRLVNLGEKQELITEIMPKEKINSYILNKEINFTSLKEKFEKAYKIGKISNEEKEKWGY